MLAAPAVRQIYRLITVQNCLLLLVYLVLSWFFVGFVFPVVIITYYIWDLHRITCRLSHSCVGAPAGLLQPLSASRLEWVYAYCILHTSTPPCGWAWAWTWAWTAPYRLLARVKYFVVGGSVGLHWSLVGFSVVIGCVRLLYPIA